MRYDWFISLSGPLNSKVCFDRQNVSGRTLWNTFKGKVRKWTKRTKLRSRYPRLSSWILRDFGGKQATNGEDEHDEDNSTRDLDDFIAAERSSNTKRKTEKDGIRVENVWRVCEQQADATLDKQVLKDVPKKKNCRRERHRQYFKLLKKHTPVLFVLLVFLYLPLVLLQKPCKAGSAPKRRHILLSSRLQTSAPFPTMSFILFSPPGSFC